MKLGLLRRGLLGTALVAAVIGLLQVLSRDGTIDPQYLPAPSDIGAAFSDGVSSGVFTEHLGTTAGRFVVGLGLAVASGLPIGILIGFSRVARGILFPVVALAYPVPVSVLIPLAIAIFGLSTSLYASVAAFTAAIPLVLGVADAVQRVSPVLVETGRTLGVSRRRIPTRVVLPAVFPKLVHSVFVSSSICVVVLVSTEILASSSGIGHLIVLAQRQYRLPDMYAAVVLVGVFGALVSFFTRLPIRLLASRYPA